MDTTKTSKIRVLIVDDSAFIRRALIKIFENHPEIQVIDVASDGEMAISQIKKLRPDVVTLDVQMPVLDGLMALDRIMKECPTRVIMLSSLTGKGGDKTLKALELGAVDFIDKTAAGGPMDISSISRELIAKIQVAARVDLRKLTVETIDAGSLEAGRITKKRETEVVLIGTSTGGPPALQTILAKIPSGFPSPILIVQHMPVGFTASLAERLNRMSAIEVKEGMDGEAIKPGTAYIAPAGAHMKLRRTAGELRIFLDASPDNALHRPSVDALLQSAASVCGHRCLTFVLTGMGKDGALGAQAIKQSGGRVVVEGEETAIVFGMPKAVMDAVTVDNVVPLYSIAETMIRML